MPVPPYVFKDKVELIENLRSDKTLAVATSFFNQRISSIGSVVSAAIGGNTFRAFQRLPERPSVVFRDWAKTYFTDNLVSLREISGSDKFLYYINEAVANLRGLWFVKMRSEMGYGPASKLVNLTLKKLACYSGLEDEFRANLIRLLHVPLDAYTIVGLKNIISNINIPSNPTMKFITDQGRYILLQNTIFLIAQEAGVPPIYYDILAWDISH